MKRDAHAPIGQIVRHPGGRGWPNEKVVRLSQRHQHLPASFQLEKMPTPADGRRKVISIEPTEASTE